MTGQWHAVRGRLCGARWAVLATLSFETLAEARAARAGMLSAGADEAFVWPPDPAVPAARRAKDAPVYTAIADAVWRRSFAVVRAQIAADTEARMPDLLSAATVAREHRAIVGAAVDARLHRLQVGERLAVAAEHPLGSTPEMFVLAPGEAPPLGQAWTVYGPMTEEISRTSRT